ncbi:MAG: hypothetical protein IJS60_03175 [Abditibacteriota bacterium]|nr:hypothetical protein [Abditibacteriota bacterium]
MNYALSSIITMLFGILGGIFSLVFFAIEYGKWKRKVIAISMEQKIIRSVSFIFMLLIFGGIFLFGFFGMGGQKKVALVTFLLVLILILFLLINLSVDLILTRKKKYFLKKEDFQKCLFNRDLKD